MAVYGWNALISVIRGWRSLPDPSYQQTHGIGSGSLTSTDRAYGLCGHVVYLSKNLVGALGGIGRYRLAYV